MKIGFHTDAFNSAYWSFEKGLAWARANQVHRDTGNTFIAGPDPVKFLKCFRKRVSHVHVKDVSASLATTLRGKDTGIAVSHCSLGGGVNAASLRKCLTMLRDSSYEGVLSIACEGAGGPMIEKSLAWLRQTLKELRIQETR
jgi:inosose dehydratase